jgi:DNA-binding NarL/FixJ family response regulator
MLRPELALSPPDSRTFVVGFWSPKIGIILARIVYSPCEGGVLARFRIIVADDSPALLRKLTSLLEVDFDVVATATDGKFALDLIRRYEPDVVVLDLGMPMLNGMEVTRELARHSPPVVICSVETDPEVVEAARRAGALAYVFKVRVEKDLISAVKSVLQGKPFGLMPLQHGSG